MKTKDSWPNFDDLPIIRSPKTILHKLARFLEEKTNNRLDAKIKTYSTLNKSGSGNKIINEFNIVTAENNSFLLLSVSHDANIYPCEITTKFKNAIAKDEDELLEALQEIFSIEKTISSLLIKSKEEEK